MKENAVFFLDTLCDPARDTVDFCDREGVGNFDMNRTKITTWAVIVKNEVEGTLDVFIFFDFLFDGFRERRFNTGPENEIYGVFDELDAGFYHKNRDKSTNVRLEANVKDEKNNSGNKDRDREEGVIEGVGAARDERVGFYFSSLFLDEEAEGEFYQDGHNKDDEGESIVFWSLGGEDFFDGFDEGC